MSGARADVADNALIASLMLHRDRLRRFLVVRCGEDSVEDLLHELWLKARLVDAQVDRPLPYLYAMADRLVLNTHRGASRRKARDGDWGYVHDRFSETAEAPVAERTLIARERLRRIDTTLRATGERARHIFRRYRLDGVDQRGIAHELGVSLSTVEKDLRKVHDALLSLHERGDEE